jgi:uncharacterized damage-inducible protein DinB
MATEVWQRGPVAGFDPLLMPVAHSLLQVKEDIVRATEALTEEQLWTAFHGAAPIGFHLRHIAGSTERLMTYARGETLTPDQLAAARREGTERVPLATLVTDVQAALDRALAQVRDTPVDSLLAERKVGRAGLPSNTLGLLFHVAEHATRHAGQAITTARIIAGGQAG